MQHPPPSLITALPLLLTTHTHEGPASNLASLLFKRKEKKDLADILGALILETLSRIRTTLPGRNLAPVYLLAPVLPSSPTGPSALHDSHLPLSASVLVDLIVCSAWTEHFMDSKVVSRSVANGFGQKGWT